jgi:glycosyltransferase involved in cell wall biosynthesis
MRARATLQSCLSEHGEIHPINNNKMKIFFCTTAPSRDYKSWSNIPYLLHKNLEKSGFVVENYVMREMEPLKTVFNLPVRVLNKYFKLGTTYFYVRTPVHFFITCLCSRFIGIISAKQDVMVVQGFSYPLHNRKNRQIILGDWPSEYLFEKFLKRQPSRLEQKSIDRENAVIESADAVVTLFPNVCSYMLKKYKNKNIYSFGNVVNVDDEIVVPVDIWKRKLKSKRFLFVGQPFYMQGALDLIAAARNLRQQGIECEVDIIGIDSSLIGNKYAWLKIHGYLDKENPDHKSRYYELLSDARLYVNTTPGWSGFQALLEAMYFHNPIVVRPNEILVSYFENMTALGYTLEGDQSSLESILIDSLVDETKYQLMSDTARKAVESLTWNSFTRKLIGLFYE